MKFKELEDFQAFTELSQRCYPGMKLDSEEAKERYASHREKMAQKKDIHTVGLFKEETLVGAYIAYDHVMNVYGKKVPAAGIGTVAVDLPYKKQGHAKRIVQKFLQGALEDGKILAHLYPFQPAFYKRMGFGLGPRLSTYHFQPSQLPEYKNASQVEVLGKDNNDEVRDCYHNWAQHVHGATDIPEYGFAFLEKEHLHTFGVREAGNLVGYMTFEFKAGDHFLQNDLHVTNFFHTTTDAYRALIRHLHNQKDQARSVYFPTFDESFAFLLDDPVHTDEKLIFSIYHKVSEEGRGLMYRILDIDAFLESVGGVSFGTESVRVGWKVTDTLLEEKYEAVWQFVEGVPRPTEEAAEVTIELDIGSFSSLMMGSVTLESLLRSGVALSDAPLKLFQHPRQPESWTFF